MNDLDDYKLGEKISDFIFYFVGSWWFILISSIVISIWVILNLSWCYWDNYPFILLNLFLSLIAAFQAPFILMSQRRCEVKQDMIYRSLFREIKELVEADLSLEHEIIEKNIRLENELNAVRKELRVIRKMLSRKNRGV